MAKKFHVNSIQQWAPFEHDGTTYDLGHLDCHEVEFDGHKGKIKFVVTYGLHCFTKDGTLHNIPYQYEDGRHSQAVCLERYEASKSLRSIMGRLDAYTLFQTSGEKFFTLTLLNNLTGAEEPYKVCIAAYREFRKLRLHVTSAFFAREGEGSPGVPVTQKGYSIFKIASDTQHKPDGQCPKEVQNRPK